MLRIRPIPVGEATAALLPPSATHAEAPANMQIIRELQNPYRELIRLQEAAEIEHKLLVQYLHGADSRKPAYDGIRGAAFSRAGPPPATGGGYSRRF